MKANNNNSFYSNYKKIDNPPTVTVFPTNKNRYVIIDEKKVNHFRKLRVNLKSILINLYVLALSFKDTSITTITPTISTTTTIDVAAETTTSTHVTTTTYNNKTYFIKLLKLIIRLYTADIELQICNYARNYTSMTVTMYYYYYLNNCSI